MLRQFHSLTQNMTNKKIWLHVLTLIETLVNKFSAFVQAETYQGQDKIRLGNLENYFKHCKASFGTVNLCYIGVPKRLAISFSFSDEKETDSQALDMPISSNE